MATRAAFALVTAGLLSVAYSAPQTRKADDLVNASDRSIIREVISAERDRARREAASRWRTQSLHRYRVETRLLCFCAPGLDKWHEITVEGDRVIAAQRVQQTTDRPEPGGGYTVSLSSFLTVDQLFRRMERLLQDSTAVASGEHMEPEFDTESGLPTWVQFWGPDGVTDSGMAVEFRKLRRG